VISDSSTESTATDRSTTGRRDHIAAAVRVVVKVGSSSLTTAGAIDTAKVDALVDVLAAHRSSGREVVLVSSGAIATGLGPLGLTRRPRDLATQQAAASVGQGILLARYTAGFGAQGRTVGQVLLTADDLIRRTHYRNAQRTLARLLELGVLPIVNENDTVATDEIRFGDNDRLAALVAHLVQADLLVLLSDVDGLYDGPPSRPGARLVPEVYGDADLSDVVVRGSGSGIGSGGMTTKVDAARIATSAGIPVVLTAADRAAEALAGESVGTLFHPTGTRTRTRLLWLRHASSVRGSLTLDAGAVDAVVRRRKSLLPAGITAVYGDFVAGDPVDLLDESGNAIARGLVDYDAGELPGMLGRSTRDLAQELGPAYEREVVHRDDLVVLRP
jgi:glutamate 5-kinase